MSKTFILEGLDSRSFVDPPNTKNCSELLCITHPVEKERASGTQPPQSGLLQFIEIRSKRNKSFVAFKDSRSPPKMHKDVPRMITAQWPYLFPGLFPNVSGRVHVKLPLFYFFFTKHHLNKANVKEKGKTGKRE